MPGPKYDQGKPDYHALPLELVRHLVPVAEAGVKKYYRFSILEDFENSNERFFGAQMRHLEKCQIDPLAIDPEDGVYEQAKVAFNALKRLDQALKEREKMVATK